MSRRMPIFTHLRLVLVAAAALSTVGCNTERLFSNRQRPEGPTTNMADSEGVVVPDIQIADAKEVDIVESVLMHRARYRKTLEILRDYYAEHGFNTKQKWAEAELADLGRVKPYKYIMSAEIPAPRLRPKYTIAEADALYDKGVELMRKGGHGVPALYNRQHMREALDVFTKMIREYPDSDKIDDAAFCNGEILKEYFKDNELLAVQWYQRCRQWDPNSPHPALFQAATIYDYRLRDRAKALELYHRVLEEETGDKSNTAFASRRIYELTEGVAQIHEPRQPLDPGTFATPALVPPAGHQSANPQGAERKPAAESGATTGSAGNTHSNGGNGSDHSESVATESGKPEMVPVADLGPEPVDE